MSRIQTVCEQAASQSRKLLVPYIVAGDPDIDASLALMHELVVSGADIIELGIPFSDPSSDGPVIQRGVERALAGGTTLADTLQLVARFREQDDSTPIVLMGYLNPIEIMGYEAFVKASLEVGIDGVLTVDMPPAESSTLHAMLRAVEIDTIYLVAPTTTPTRAKSIVEHSSGYLYYVSLKGVTGAALIDHESVAAKIAQLRDLSSLPVLIGFGIKDGPSAAAMAKLADGVIIGSALVERIAALTRGEPPTTAQLREITDVIAVARQAVDTLE